MSSQNVIATEQDARLRAVKSWLWFFVVLLLVLSFPLQVYTLNPYPALLPYFLISLIVMRTWFSARKGILSESKIPYNRNIDLMVGVYVILVLLNTAGQTALGVITPFSGASALVVYFLPVAFYWYFRSVASVREIRAVLLGMVVASIVGGVFFVYDSYQKLALNQISDYAQEAYQYSIMRASEFERTVVSSRARTGHRSFGLLEVRAVSATWNLLGVLAVLALVPSSFKILRRVVILIFGVIILLSLNMTAIVSFSFIMLLFEFGGLALLHGRRTEFLGNLVWLVLMLALVAGVAYWIADDAMWKFIVNNITYQMDLLLGLGAPGLNWREGGTYSYAGFVGLKMEGYYQSISNFPHTLLLGDGFSGFGLPKGGHVGLIESLAKFGVPYFLLIVYGLFRLIKSGLTELGTKGDVQPAREVELDHRGLLQFAVSVTLVVLINEGHYSVWTSKSILPIVFLALALYGRILAAPPRPVPNEDE